MPQHRGMLGVVMWETVRGWRSALRGKLEVDRRMGGGVVEG